MFRSGKYVIWRACQRFGVKPPGVKDTWDKCGLQAQLDLLNFDEISTVDQSQMEVELATLGMHKRI